MGKIIKIKIGSYTYESNEKDNPIPEIYIERHVRFSPRIIQIKDYRYKAYFEPRMDFFGAKTYAGAILYPLTYSNNPYILTPENK